MDVVAAGGAQFGKQFTAQFSLTAHSLPSSLQRTILTAEHIPHPLVSFSLPVADCLSTFMQHELPSARLPHHSGDDAAGGLPSLGSSPKMEPKVVGRTSAEVEAAAASLHLEAYGEEEPEEMWEQMSPRVYRNLDEIFAGEYEGMRSAMGNSGGAILRAVL